MKKKIIDKIGVIAYGYFLLTAIIMILYAVGYSTGWAMGDSTGGNIGTVVGKTAFKYNQLLFMVAVVIFITWLLGLITGNINKQVYKITNYISLSLVVLSILSYALISVIAALEIRPIITQSLIEDKAMWDFIFLLNKGSERDIFFILNFSTVLLVLSILSVIIGLFLAYIKFKKQKERKEIRMKYLEALEEGYLEKIKFKGKNIVE